MLAGEWWRAVTALTLHADLAHVLANAVAIAIFLGAVARRLGPALATWLALAAGVAGNVLTALVAGGGHVSLGASTAVFGALGRGAHCSRLVASARAVKGTRSCDRSSPGAIRGRSRLLAHLDLPAQDRE